MENCLDTRRLIEWLDGSLNEESAMEIGEHIENCERCLNRLEALTDDSSVNPPSNPENLLRGDTFTDEPIFRSMQIKLTEQVSDLARHSRKTAQEDFRDLNNSLTRTSVDSRVETVAHCANTTFTGTPAPVISADSDTPLEIEGFHIEGIIGRGGFAHVYRAWDKRLARNVAIKILDRARLNSRNRHRFLREAKTASSLQSPNVVQVLSSGESQGRPFIVMELVEGQTLSQWIENAYTADQIDSVTIDRGVRILIQVCQGLQAVHDAGLVHRDIKPGNIFLDSTASAAKLGDFGLARILDQDTVTLTRDAELAGTPNFMSPEQTTADADVTPASDIYSIGATLYNILVGKPPFQGSSMAIVKQVAENRPVPPNQLNESVSRDLATICLRTLEKDPGTRFGNALSLADDLQRTLDGQPILSRPVSAFQRATIWAKSHRALAATAGLLALTILVSGAVGSSLWRSSQRNARMANENKRREIENQEQLIGSVIVELETTFSRKSKYIEISSEDRMRTIDSVRDTCESVFDGQRIHNREQIRNLVKALASAAEVHLELMLYESANDLIAISLPLAHQNFEMPDSTVEDRVILSWIYNQRGGTVASKGQTIKAHSDGKAAWNNAVLPNGKSSDFFRRALELSSSPTNDDGNLDLLLQNLYAQWSLTCLNIELESTEATTKNDLIQRLQKLLKEVASIRTDHPRLSALWLSLHQRMLNFLAKRFQGQQLIDLRIQRARVFKEYLEQLEQDGKETYWYDRTVALNDFYIGIECLKMGQPTVGRESIVKAIKRLEDLTIAFPNSNQFRADVAEGKMVIGNLDWDSDKLAAMKSYDDAISQFERLLRTDSAEIAIRRRTAHVYELLASKNNEMDNERKAANYLAKSVRHMQVVVNSPYDGFNKKQDSAALTRMRQSAAKAFEHVGDSANAKHYRQQNEPTAN